MNKSNKWYLNIGYCLLDPVWHIILYFACGFILSLSSVIFTTFDALKIFTSIGIIISRCVANLLAPLLAYLTLTMFCHSAKFKNIGVIYLMAVLKSCFYFSSVQWTMRSYQYFGDLTTSTTNQLIGFVFIIPAIFIGYLIVHKKFKNYRASLSPCPACGELIESNSLFCGECGYSIKQINPDLPDTQDLTGIPLRQGATAIDSSISIKKTSPISFCYKCGAKLAEGSAFCPKCGKKVPKI
ncbi:zinc ribbon domain-containing protein [Christensenella sp. MSJ-20]|uniref:zinc ribbon domain-containing protein n=1 Tax=Christensenella sp. MSJ-20 TaxID=2841518 RepID=UPI001C783771|nr:zinc ribbon domain-containing protein [Christensenella sp. MSJ-20]